MIQDLHKHRREANHRPYSPSTAFTVIKVKSSAHPTNSQAVSDSQSTVRVHVELRDSSGPSLAVTLVSLKDGSTYIK
jgi:hypothetical protein